MIEFVCRRSVKARLGARAIGKRRPWSIRRRNGASRKASPAATAGRTVSNRTRTGARTLMGQSPSFRFFPQDFLTKTEGLAKRHRAYFAMLTVHLHARGTASMPVADAKRTLGMKAGPWRDFLESLVEADCIEVDPSGRYLRQPAVGRELAARAALSAVRRSAGQASAASRRRRRVVAEAGG